MVYHDPFRRLAFSGRLFGAEDWSCGITMGHVGLGAGSQPETVPEAIISAAEQFFSIAAVGAYCTLTTIKYNFIDVHGKYADPTLSTRWDAASPTTGGGSNIGPPQEALAISLRTAHMRGLAHQGRFYLPGYAATLGSDGRISVGTALAVAEQVTTFLNALNAVEANYKVCVVSQIAAGAQNEVTHCRIGRVVDTIRSRRSSLLEDWQSGATLA